MAHILVIDDDAQVLNVVKEMLQIDGHSVETAADGNLGLDLFRGQTFDLVITDLIMPDKEGLETIVDLHALRQDVPIVAMSGGGRIGPVDYLDTAKYIGANATLPKPFTRAELSTVVNDLLGENSTA